MNHLISTKQFDVKTLRKIFQLTDRFQNKKQPNLLKGKIVAWHTGGDGIFDIEVRQNPETSLTSEEKGIVELKNENLKLIITSKVMIGSPEWAGSPEEDGLKENAISQIEGINQGTYAVSVFFLYSEEVQVAKFVVVIKKVDPDFQFQEVFSIPSLG